MASKTAKVETGKFPTGWAPNPKEVDKVLGALPHPVFGITAYKLKDSGAGKIALAHKAFEKIGRKFPIREQTAGTCVSQGWACAVDIVRAVQIATGARERYPADTATEPIYAGSRVEIGGGQLGRGDGSIGAWAAKYVTTDGTLVREKYGDIDLTRADDRIAVQWGMPGRGVPDELEPKSREHLIRTVSLCQSYEEARDALVGGLYPTPVCSNQGFTSRRDAEGFCRPSGSWSHCMVFIGVDDESKRPGLLCMNSWGPNWVSGPKRHDQPDGSFWVDAETCTRMLRGGDSFAISGYEGFPELDLDFSGL